MTGSAIVIEGRVVRMTVQGTSGITVRKGRGKDYGHYQIHDWVPSICLHNYLHLPSHWLFYAVAITRKVVEKEGEECNFP
jgi:hypothetical protein